MTGGMMGASNDVYVPDFAPKSAAPQAIEVLQPESVQILTFKVKPEAEVKAAAAARTIDIGDPHSVLRLGHSSAASIAEMTGQALQDVHLREGGEVGAVISGLLSKLHTIRPDSVPKAPSNRLESIAAHVPVIGKRLAPAVHAFSNFLEAIKDVEQSIGAATDALLSEEVRQREHFGRIEALRGALREQVDTLEVAIVAGRLKLTELLKSFNDRASRTRDEETDVRELYELAEEREALRRLDRRVCNLHAARHAAIALAAGLRVAQEGALGVQELVRDCLVHLIPVWRQHAVMALALHDQKVALTMVESTREATARIIEANGGLLTETNAAIADQRAKGATPIEALTTFTKVVIDALQSGLELERKIQRDQRVALNGMQTAERELFRALEKTRDDGGAALGGAAILEPLQHPAFEA